MVNYLERTEELFDKMFTHVEQSVLYRNQIIELNLKLVSHVLKKYRPYTDDQYQIGCLGLILSVDTYKKERGVPFPHYACFCIERELHKYHKKKVNQIETILKDNLVYLDADYSSNDESKTMSLADTISDIMAEEDFRNMIEINDLEYLFDQIIIPAINSVAKSNRGQKTKIDPDEWQKFELRYLLEMSNGSQKMRFNLTQMAKQLNASVQNLRGKHQRVISNIKELYEGRGLHEI